MICTRKVLLELIIEKKPELETIILKNIELNPPKNYFSGNGVCCYICDGKNLNCIDYKNYEAEK